jgi:hypothetical protein
MRATVLSVYDSRNKIGELVERCPHQIEAIAIDGTKRKKLGIFPNRHKAMRALDGVGDAR